MMVRRSDSTTSRPLRAGLWTSSIVISLGSSLTPPDAGNSDPDHSLFSGLPKGVV